MPNSGRTPQEALSGFRDGLNRLLAKTITERPLAGVIRATPGEATGRMTLGFRSRGFPRRIPISTRFGELYLYLGQLCETKFEDGEHLVRTVQYGYTISESDSRDDDPVLRWEYERRWPDGDSRWCRHHLQGAVDLTVAGQRIELSDIHLPTGYVPIEDVIRFCIVDLEVRPLSDDWHERLEESYDAFRTPSSPPR